MNILIASDSYKGSLSSKRVAELIEIGVREVMPEANVIKVAVADGGEGTVDSMISCVGGTLAYCTVSGPLGADTNAEYGIFDNGNAIMEMAEASGLTLIEEAQLDILKASTYGTGQMIKAALDRGCREIYIGIGGSATNDGGIGMAQALGAHFYDKDGCEVGRGGGELERIEKIDLNDMDHRLKNSKLITMCDVSNLLCGPTGAAAIYGPQKGATPELIKRLDDGLSHLAGVIKRDIGIDVLSISGGGAAGGLGMGLVAFTGAKLQSGIEAVLQAVNIEEKIRWADLVITGEGRIDGQSMNGKVPMGIASKAAQQDVATIAIVGCIGENAQNVFENNIDSLESCVVAPCTIEDALMQAETNLVFATERIIRSISVGLKLKLRSQYNENSGSGRRGTNGIGNRRGCGKSGIFGCKC
ncbi:MAG: glycerate kinase [Oscillospiraceae bacterium]